MAAWMISCRRMLGVALVLWSVGFFSARAFALDGYMASVTVKSGKIMDGSKVIAEVPRGTRLWVFEEKPGWFEVKVPNGEQHGWISAQALKAIEYTAQQHVALKKAVALSSDYDIQLQNNFHDAANESISKCLQLEQSVYGLEHPALADSLVDLGSLIHNHETDVEAARKHFETALGIYRRVLGNQHDSVVLTLSNLGLNRVRVGKYEDARELYQESLAISREIHGQEHLELAERLNKLGSLQYELGELNDARKTLEAALELRRKLGASFEDEVSGQTLYLLGTLAASQNRNQAAEQYFQQSLKFFRDSLNNDFSKAADILAELAVVVSLQGDHAGAFKHLQAAKQSLEQDLGLPQANNANLAFDNGLVEPANRAHVLYHQGLVEFAQRDYPAAGKSWDTALGIYKELPSYEGFKMARVQHQLGELARQQGNTPVARKHYEEALSIRRQRFGDKHPDTVATALQLAQLTEAPENIANKNAPKLSQPNVELPQAGVVNAPQLPKPAALQQSPANAPSPAAKAFDGVMGIVTAEKGKIMDGDKVLAEVPRGVRLWVFSINDIHWCEVKLPEKEEHGWISGQQILPVKIKDEDQADLKRAGELLLQGKESQKAGMYSTANNQYQSCLAISRRVWGDDHPNTGMILNNLGNVAIRLREFAAAEKYHNEALKIRQHQFGRNHAETAESLNNLGSLAEAIGQYREAKKLHEEALEIQRRVLGSVHADMAGTLNNLGLVATHLEDFQTAKQYLTECLEMTRKKMGQDHPYTATTLINLAELSQKQAAYLAAIKNLDEALSIYRKAFGNNHPEIARMLSNQSVCFAALNDHQKALSLLEESLVIRRKTLGNDHPDTAISLNNLGQAAARRDYPAAKNYYNEAFAILTKKLGKDHPDSTTALSNLAFLAARQGESAQAKKLFTEVFHSYQEKLGDAHPLTAKSQLAIGVLEFIEMNSALARAAFASNRQNARNHTQRALLGLTNAEQVQFLKHTYLDDFYITLSFGWLDRQDQASLAASAEWLINGKAVAQEALAQRELLFRDSQNPAAARLVAELQNVRRQLSVMSLTVSAAGEI